MTQIATANSRSLLLGSVGGTEIGVQHTQDGQDILIQQTDTGRNLANLLAVDDMEFVRQGDSLYWRIPHTREVDRLLTEIIDLFISIRYAHPTLVQLELALPAPSGAEGSEPRALEPPAMKPALPPSYVNMPVSIAYADVDDALIVTMTRILGLCWAHDYERTPPLSADQLIELTGRPRTTLYRHLGVLETELRWLRIDRSGRRLILRPLTGLPGANPATKGLGPQSPTPTDQTSAPTSQELADALAAAAIENPARDQLAAADDLDPAWVHAWHLWTHHPHRASLNNPAGLIVRKLQSREPPPAEYLQLVTLTDAERSELRASFWTGGESLDDRLYELRPLFFEVYGSPRDG